jgi:hypothetical protein
VSRKKAGRRGSAGPAAGFHRGEKLCDVEVEEPGFLVVASELVAPDERCTVAGDFVIEIDAVDVSDGHGNSSGAILAEGMSMNAVPEIDLG